MAPEAELRVAPEFVEMFRLGALKALSFDAEWLKDQADEARRWLEEGRCDDPYGHVGTSEGPVASIAEIGSIVHQLGAGKPNEPLQVKARANALVESLEATCSLGSEHLSELAEAPVVVAWAAGEIVRLNATEAVTA